MPYEDDDLFGEEFDFVDDDDDAEGGSDEQAEEADQPKPRRRSSAKSKTPTERGKGRGKSSSAGSRRTSRSASAEPEAPEPEPEPAAIDDEAEAEAVEEYAPREEAPPEPVGPPADHVVHVYEHGRFKRTIARKFTDEEAVSFAEEYTRTGKAYGRYAVATPDDEEPAPTFAGASRGG